MSAGKKGVRHPVLNWRGQGCRSEWKTVISSSTAPSYRFFPSGLRTFTLYPFYSASSPVILLGFHKILGLLRDKGEFQKRRPLDPEPGCVLTTSTCPNTLPARSLGRKIIAPLLPLARLIPECSTLRKNVYNFLKSEVLQQIVYEYCRAI